MVVHGIEDLLVRDRRLPPLVLGALERPELDDPFAGMECHVQHAEVWLIVSSDERRLRRLVPESMPPLAFGLFDHGRVDVVAMSSGP
jgi:hypothetical protein